MPKVSVVLPTYNGSKYIQESIESILCQTWKDFELIIVNDCSTDSTLEIIKEFAKKDSRIKIISNETNQKLPKSLNIGFKTACGDFFTWTSDDNRMKPKALEIMCEKLEHNPELGLVYCDMDRIDAEGNLIEEVKWPESHELYKGDCVGACFMYRASVTKKIGGYDENMFLAEDYEYWLRIWKESSIAHIPVNAYQYRVHNASLTGTRQKDIFHQTSRLWMRYLDDLLKLVPNYKEKRIFFDCILLSAASDEVVEMKRKLCTYSFRYRMRCLRYDMVRIMKICYHKIKK